MERNPLVSIVIGSKSDEEIGLKVKNILEENRVSAELVVLSAHRNPDELREYIKESEKKGVKIFIAMAGLAAHLPGFIASHTKLPVIGVPLDVGPLRGVDALLSIVQMPRGVPVACMGIGEHGALNSAYFALRILSLINKE